MPSIDMSRRDLQTLCRHTFKNRQELEDALWLAKTELESLEGDLIKASVADTNRPDLLSTEGIARELRYRLGKQKPIQQYRVTKSGIRATVDPALSKIRPAAAYAVARNVKITDQLLDQLIQLQEKICMTFGQKRREVAIGIFDLEQVHGNVRYFAADPKTEFIPLDFRTPMTLSEILTEHPKGKEYGPLIAHHSRYPLLVDSKNQVLSMPPIINSAGSGRVTANTRHLFLDVTGFNQRKINTALAIFCAALSDRGAQIQSVQINYGQKTIQTPVFENQHIVFPAKLLLDVTGIKQSNTAWKKRFTQSGFLVSFKGSRVTATYSNLRQDILHGVDVIEDLLISTDFNAIALETPQLAVVGSQSASTVLAQTLRDACIGMGLQEILTYTLTSIDKQTTRSGILRDEFAQIANPVSSNWEIFRKTLYPEALEFLSKNKHAPYPHKIFETGKTVSLDAGSETGVAETQTLCIAIADQSANFTLLQSHAQALAAYLGQDVSFEPVSHPSFEEGKSARVKIGNATGILGEIKSDVRNNFGLRVPVGVLEISFASE